MTRLEIRDFSIVEQDATGIMMNSMQRKHGPRYPLMIPSKVVLVTESDFRVFAASILGNFLHAVFFVIFVYFGDPQIWGRRLGGLPLAMW